MFKRLKSSSEIVVWFDILQDFLFFQSSHLGVYQKGCRSVPSPQYTPTDGQGINHHIEPWRVSIAWGARIWRGEQVLYSVFKEQRVREMISTLTFFLKNSKKIKKQSKIKITANSGNLKISIVNILWIIFFLFILENVPISIYIHI